MKQLIITLFVVLFNIVVTAQNNSSVQKETFEVNGVCLMCKERIEGCLAEVAGIKKAKWNKETHQLNVVFNSKKISLEKIKQIVADSGHDTDTVKADDKKYKELPDCCAYRDGAKCDH